jgi:hypothetical protein
MKTTKTNAPDSEIAPARENQAAGSADNKAFADRENKDTTVTGANGNTGQTPPLPERSPQRTKIERLRSIFLANPNAWISMPELVRVSGSYVIHSGASTLRKQHRMVIHCEQKDRIENGNEVKRWEYRYRPDYRYILVETPEGARKRVAVPNGKIMDTSTTGPTV